MRNKFHVQMLDGGHNMLVGIVCLMMAAALIAVALECYGTAAMVLVSLYLIAHKLI